MLEKGKISAGEFQILIIFFFIGTTILNIPSLLTTVAKQGAWIASALTLLISLFFIFIYNHLISLCPSMTFVEVNEKIFGKWFGKISALFYLFYAYHNVTGSLRQIGDFFTTQVLVETPIEMTMTMFLITSLIGVRLGIEVICRTAVIFFPWTIFLLFILFLFLLPEIQLEKIQPIFGEGMKPISKATYSHMGLPYLQLAIFLMFTPYVTEKAKMKKAFYSGTLIGGIVLTIVILYCILVLGADITARQSYPSYILGKKISIVGFLDRVEVIVAIIWILTVYFKVTICYYVIAIGLAQVFKLKSYKILIFPLAFLIITFATFIHPNSGHLNNFIAKTWTPYSLTMCFFLPLLLLIVGKIRNRSASKSTI